MIYMDPPYGVKFGSNFQPFVRKRDVGHGADENMTREPEMVQAYRDTWELGLHSYLTYMRDRLVLGRELMASSGSIFVQISDENENLHHVRELMDEVFRPENFCGLIVFRTTGGQSTALLTADVSRVPLALARQRLLTATFPWFSLKDPARGPSAGADVRCIVSVGMLTEGWDCNTLTHIIGLRPFMSQLLCEQVVGRGLRRASYELNEDGKFSEEVAKVFGVPFEVIPYKSDPKGGAPKKEKRHHVYAVPSKAGYEIRFPRVEGYTRAIRNRVTVDWNSLPELRLVPGTIPPEVDVKGGLPNNEGRFTLSGPGAIENVSLNPYRKGRRLQELVFDMAAALTRDYKDQPHCEVPTHVLFPQMAKIVQRYLKEFVEPVPPANILDVFLSPYYGWVVERLLAAIRPDTSMGEAPEVPRYETNRGPGSTADVDYWTSREPREVVHSHLNYLVPDTKRWEQSAGYYIDNHAATAAFVKNAGLGFSIPYLHNGQIHDYIPDFIVKLKTTPESHLIVETKGYDPLTEVKTDAAARWVSAVNADGTHGRWMYAIARKPEEVAGILASAVAKLAQ